MLSDFLRREISDEERKAYFDKRIPFEATIADMRSMLKKGIITVEEYYQCEAMFAEKYGLTVNSIFLDKNMGRFSTIPSLYNAEPQEYMKNEEPLSE